MMTLLGLIEPARLRQAELNFFAYLIILHQRSTSTLHIEDALLERATLTQEARRKVLERRNSPAADTESATLTLHCLPILLRTGHILTAVS
jgi:hypothetical protein